MKNQTFHNEMLNLGMAVILGLAVSFEAIADKNCRLLTADRVFDGNELHVGAAVVVKDGRIVRIDAEDKLKKLCDEKMKLGDATILPGFIESHAHLTFQKVPSETVLKHGVTTVRDVGGPLLPMRENKGELRLLSSGPIIQAPGGYPLNIFGGEGGYDQVGITVETPEEARDVVRHLAEGGAALIKIALEPGGEAGAPWMFDHGHGTPATPWPLMNSETVRAIVETAHQLGKTVSAHIGENGGAKLALDAGVDEWSHIPCAAIDDEWLRAAVEQGVKFVTTIDTLSSCAGIHDNVHRLTHIMEQMPGTGAEFIYGSEIGHDNVPWGVNGEEMALMLHLTSGRDIDFADVIKVVKAATSRAGENLGQPLLGTLQPGAQADIIAIRGNPFERFKLFEYPDMVMVGGQVVLNHFEPYKGKSARR